MVGIAFLASGWNDLKNPLRRSKDIGMSKGFTIFLSAEECAEGLGVISGRSERLNKQINHQSGGSS